MKPLLIYSPGYDFSMLGLERLHPFDAKKFSRAWSLIEAALGGRLPDLWREPSGGISDQDLLRVHTKEHLDSLRSSSVAAKAMEIGMLRFVPASLIERGLLRPMRLAVAGTVLATELALGAEGAIAMNLGGGYHHAFRDHGEGFCLYADVAVAIAIMRARGALSADAPIAMVDLDAHRGNGMWEILSTDPAVHVLDIYNFQNYPGLFPGDMDAHPFLIPVKARTSDERYLALLGKELPTFLDSIPCPRLAFYNAGSDIVAQDPIGGLAVTPDGVALRDRLVVDAMIERGIPTVVVTSGGYGRRSHELVAKLALTVVERAGGVRNRFEPASSGQ